ncbi:polysaccharide pyruvyl transferase family protein [Citrobacter braakii]|uniref:polysaccharide pyruvyl transferase family protein n=1 Tax=Citrobacter braakii TaxID=57706 RepID=UPI0024B252EF|nr:polysaccharide pyruvyl transferase family protein [Citrobacter braakii]WFX02984.1 polysaccharide pyruvyl transferase family protein [Citrobacter braakii]
MNKKIGLLTLPLIANYGGILQCLSLTFVLRKMGYEVTLIDIRPSLKPTKRFLLYILARLPFQNIRGIREKFFKEKQNKETIQKYINKYTKKIENIDEFKNESKKLVLDAIIVGSDQVWRYDYINNDMYSAYFLDFYDGKKISYAASFGVDVWKHEDRRQLTKSLLEQFDAISVREDTGIDICRDEFSIESVVHVLDPTMLDLSFYDDLLSSHSSNHEAGYLLKYILDEKETARVYSSIVKDNLGIVSEKDIHGDNKYYTLAEWVQAFKNAEYVITDSFHGMVFSIIFNKNFIAIGNKSRGLSRFISLLTLVGLEERLVYPEDITSSNTLSNVLLNDIDYSRVNKIVEAWREKSLNYLANSLNNPKN